MGRAGELVQWRGPGHPSKYLPVVELSYHLLPINYQLITYYYLNRFPDQRELVQTARLRTQVGSDRSGADR